MRAAHIGLASHGVLRGVHLAPAGRDGHFVGTRPIPTWGGGCPRFLRPVGWWLSGPGVRVHTSCDGHTSPPIVVAPQPLLWGRRRCSRFLLCWPRVTSGCGDLAGPPVVWALHVLLLCGCGGTDPTYCGALTGWVASRGMMAALVGLAAHGVMATRV